MCEVWRLAGAERCSEIVAVARAASESHCWASSLAVRECVLVLLVMSGRGRRCETSGHRFERVRCISIFVFQVA
jgi:hypothetical protein